MSVGTISMIVGIVWVGLAILAIAICAAAAHSDAVSERVLLTRR